MSPHGSKKALQLLEANVKAATFEDANVYFVLSYPRSDMGKGTLVAHMLRILENSDALKFDGLLNTNANGRHTAEGHDDFGIYEKYNPEKKFGDERYILGGYLYKDFIDTYGEYENLTFRPYVAKYFITTLHKMWVEIGKPKNIIIEIGGLITDFEVDPYVTPAIRELKERLKDRCKIILLGEISYNNEYVKTKGIQDAVAAFMQRMIKPDIILARESAEMGKVQLQERTEIERALTNKLTDNLGVTFESILSVPFFEQKDIDMYGDFLDKYLRPILTPLTFDGRIFIGSNNKNKQNDWHAYAAGKATIVTPDELSLDIEVSEGMTSIEENSLAKAKAWCRASGMLTISDDTGFYLDELNGQPGVAVKRWAGALPEDVTNEQFFEYMRKQVEPLKDTSCHFKTVVTIASPNGTTKQITHLTRGKIDKELLAKGYVSGYPLGLVFKKTGRDKVWADMSDKEKQDSDRELAEKVLTYIQNSIN